MGSSELQFCPHGVDVGLTEDNDCPPAGLHTVDDLIRNHFSNIPVSGVNQTFKLVLNIFWILQTWQKRILHIITVCLRVRDEGIIRLLFVNEVLREEVSGPMMTVQADPDSLSVTGREKQKYGDDQEHENDEYNEG